MSSYGITPYLRDQILTAITAGGSLTIPMTAAQLHVGAPALGTANLSAVGYRMPITLTFAAGIVSLTGDVPAWSPMPSPEDVNGLSIWDTITYGSGNCLLTAPTSMVAVVADGDKYQITGFTLPFTTGLAS
jgi:hypothetical protein